MLWGHNYPAPKAKKFEALMKIGRDVPDDYRDKPRIYSGDEAFLQAFNRLSRSRPQAMDGLAPIPWDKMDEYARKIGYPRPDEFCAIIEIMDNSLLEWHRDKKSNG